MATDDKTERADVSAVPLYQQVMDDLKGEIARGVYAPGSRIPSEMELAKSYGVGRITVRRAIEELSRAGYLNRQQGRCTFVCAPKLKRKIRQKGDVQSFTEGCAANDMVAGARLVSRTVVAATREDAAFFGVEPGCELIVVERVRTADGVPVMLENNAFVLADHPYLQTLADEGLADNSIFALVAEHSGRAPLKSDPCTVEIALADAQAARCWRCRSASRSSIWRLTLPMRTGCPCCSGVKRSWARATCLTSNAHRQNNIEQIC